jgi:hypothetical protein
MNNKDEDLNERFDQEAFFSEGIDEHIYQKISDALKREPEYTLPIYFADRLVTLIETKEKAKEVSRDNLWLGLGLFSFVIALIVAFVLTDFKASVGAFRFFAGYPGLIIFGISFILLLNWVDKKILRKAEAF